MSQTTAMTFSVRLGKPYIDYCTGIIVPGPTQKLLNIIMNYRYSYCSDHNYAVILHLVLQTFSILAIRQYLL